MRKSLSTIICHILNKMVPFFCPRYFIRDIRGRDQFCIERIGGRARLLSLKQIRENNWVYQGLIYRDKCYIDQLISYENKKYS